MSPAPSRSTSARRPAASPTCCCSAARGRSSRSTSATGSSTGGCAPTPASSCCEHVNARHLTPDDLPGPFDVVTIDVSFISLRQILPVVPPRLSPDGHVVALVKPQFEAGREDVERGGLVTDPAVHARVLEEVRAAARAVGLTPMADTPSPITGATGNQEFLLHLRSPAMTVERVGIVAKQGLDAAAPHLAAILQWLEARGIESILETETAELAELRDPPALSRDALASQVDLLLVLGGDGTLLGMAARVGAAGRAIPILGVNFGRLGFLTEVTLDELHASLEAVIAGTAQVHERRLLQAVDPARRRRVRDSHVVLNDVVVTRGEISRVIDLEVTVNGQFVTRVKADGIIVASPTGSTAYNLAASGPIVHPEVDAILITPIAPHTLANRPIVIPGSAVVEVRAIDMGRTADIFVTFDGQTGHKLGTHRPRAASRAPKRPCGIVSSPSRGYFDTLREKLGWGER